MASLIFTSGVFEGCVIDDGEQWKDVLNCRYYHSSSKKLKLVFHKWLKKEKFKNITDMTTYAIAQYWRYWLDSWTTDIFDADANGDAVFDRTEF